MPKVIYSVVGVALLLAACVAPTSVTPTETPAQAVTMADTPAPTDTPVPLPTDTPLPTSTATTEPTSFESGGLGLQTVDFEKSHVQTGTDIMGAIYDNNLIVSFQNDRVWYIEQQWGSGASATPEEAEAIGETLIPADSVLVETYSPDGRPETTVKLYMSESLRTYFGEWNGGEPGNFIVQYNTIDGAVTRLVISTGNNP